MKKLPWIINGSKIRLGVDSLKAFAPVLSRFRVRLTDKGPCFDAFAEIIGPLFERFPKICFCVDLLWDLWFKMFADMGFFFDAFADEKFLLFDIGSCLIFVIIAWSDLETGFSVDSCFSIKLCQATGSTSLYITFSLTWFCLKLNFVLSEKSNNNSKPSSSLSNLIKLTRQNKRMKVFIF